MKNTPQYDVGDFFRNKLEGFEAEPPEYIWNNIQTVVTSQTTTSTGSSVLGILKSKIFIATLIGVIAITSVIIAYNFYDTKEQKSELINNSNFSKKTPTQSVNTVSTEVSAKNDTKNSTLLNSKFENTVVEKKSNSAKETENKVAPKNETVAIIEESKVEQAHHVLANESTTKETTNPAKNKKKLYFINLTEYKDIESVSFVDAQGIEKVKINEVTKNFEHFPIDITGLPLGKYGIKIKTKTGTFNAKTVTL